MTDLDREMRALLGRLEMLSHGSTQAWNKSGGHSGEPDDRMVATVARRVEEPPHVFYRRVYFAAEAKNRRRIHDEAQAVYDAWLHSPPPPERQEDEAVTIEQWIVVDGVGWEAEVVARRFNVDPAFVRRTRQRAGRNVDDGSKNTDSADPMTRARELRERGLTTRQIALTVGASQSQVVRWIKREAA